MPFSAISFITHEYDRSLYKNWWLKAYEQGTVTPKVMAIDSDGTGQASRFELNTQGFPITAGSVMIIPHVDGPYDLWLFPTAAEADANDTTNALKFADDIKPPDVVSNQTEYDLGTGSANTPSQSSHTGIVTGHVIKTNYLDSNRRVDSGAEFAYSGSDDVLKAGNWPDADGSFYDADGKKFSITEINTNPRQFGAAGDGSTDDTTALQIWLDFISGAGATRQARGIMGLGTYKYTSDLNFDRNTNIEGQGQTFRTSFLPVGDAKLNFDGDLVTGGFVFHCSMRNILIDATQTTATEVINCNKAFSCNFEHVRVHDATASVANNMLINDSNDITLYNPVFFSASNSSGTGIAVTGDSSVKIFTPDVELWLKGIRCIGSDDSVVDIFGIYAERNIQTIEHTGGHLNVYGGLIKNPSSSAIAIVASTNNINVYSTRFERVASDTAITTANNTTDGSHNVNFYGISGSDIITDWPVGIVGNKKTDEIVESKVYNKKDTFPDNVATDIFRVSGLTGQNTCHCVYTAQVTSQGFGKSLKRVEFIVVRESAGTLKASPLTSTLDSSENPSGNWSLTMTLAEVENTNDVTLTATIDLTGTLNQGGTVPVAFTLGITSDQADVKVEKL
ncbi:MAG: glycosyl hydrolase family 28-related protein [Syntrophobacteria bacterium]